MTVTPTLPLWNPSRAWFAYLLVFSSAFGCYSTGFGDIGMTPINLVTFCLMPVVLIDAMKNGKIPNLTALGVFHLLYFLISLAGVLFARNKYGALHGSGGYLMDYFLCFFFVMYFIRTRNEVETAVRLFIFLGIISSIMGTIELTSFLFSGEAIGPPFVDLLARGTLPKNYGYGTGYLSIPGFIQMYGFFPPTSSAFGSYMLIPFGLALYKSVMARHKKLLWYITTIIFGVVIFLSMSRNAYGGALFFVLISFLFYRSKKPVAYAVLVRSLILLIPVAALLLIFYATRESRFYSNSEVEIARGVTIRTPFYLIQRMNPFVSLSFQKSGGYMSSFSKIAVEHGSDNLGFGLGAQNFDDFIWEYHPINYGSHSDFINFLGDTGVWGLATQIAIVLTTLFYGIKTYYSRPLDRVDHLPLYLVAIYIGLVVVGILRTFYLTPHTFIVMGLIARLYTLREEKKEKQLAVTSRSPSFA